MIKNTTYRWAMGLCALLLVAAALPLSARDAALPPGADFQEGIQGASSPHRQKRSLISLPRYITKIIKGGHRYVGTVRADRILSAMHRFLGPDYITVGHGRFQSKDGLRQVRYGSHEGRSKLPHVHFEARKNKLAKFTERALADIMFIK